MDSTGTKVSGHYIDRVATHQEWPLRGVPLYVKFATSGGVNVTLDVKISPTLCHSSPQEFWKEVKRISKSS